MKSLVKVLFFTVLIMCGSCTCVKPADGDNQVGKDENDSKERVLSSDLSDQDIGSFFVSAARCKKNEAVPGFEDANKILNAADGQFRRAAANQDDAESFTMLYVLVSGYPNAAHALREKIFHASKQDFRFNLMCGMIYGKPDAVPLLENGNSVIMFLSRMQNVLEKYAPCEETLCESRIFACKMNTASWILDIYDVLCSGKFVSFPEKTFGPPDRRISGICADTVSLLKKNMYHSYSRETLKILLRHVHSMMTTAPGGLFGIPGSMVPATGGTNFTECEITELERILAEIIKRDSDFRYWKNYHSLFQTIAGYSLDKKSLAECLEEQYKKYPAKLDYLCASAVLHHLTGDIKKSEETWKTLYAAAEKNGIEPEPEAVTYHICFEFHDMGRREKAIADLKTALSRYLENVSICLTAVNLFAKLNMVSEVEDAARRLPESFEKYCHLIHTALYEERVADALAFGDKIIQKYPAAVRTGEKASVFWSAYLHAAFALGKSHLGIQYADEYLRNNPNDVMILQTAGNLLLSSDMCLDRAEEYFKRGLKAEPDNAILLKNMGWLKYKQGLYFEARRIFFESFLVSKDYMSELYVSEFFSQFGDIQAACGEWKMANALWSTSLDAGKSFLSREERLMLEFKIENSRKYFENNDNTENKERQ